MNRFLLLTLFLSFGRIEAAEPDSPPPRLEFSISSPTSGLDEKIRSVFHKIAEGTIYFSAGGVLGSAYLLTRLGWGICQISPWASTAANECLLLSNVCGGAAKNAFAHLFKGPSSLSPLFRKVPLSQHSWHLNQTLLSQIPAFSHEDKQLLMFLEKRWLAKTTGFYSTVVDWMCPCFGISIQVHPETTNSYARDPSNKFSQTYTNRVEDWKHSLPHPQHYPLILTRPHNVRDYLPSYLDVPQDEKSETTVERALKMQMTDSKLVVDLTHVLDDAKDQKKWLHTWKVYQMQFLQACKERNLNPKQILCIQQVQQGEIGGIRLLPFDDFASETEQHYQFLLVWISKFGLSANRVELDRCDLPSNTPARRSSVPPLSIGFQSKEAFVSDLDSFDQNWTSDHPQKNLMLKGTLQVLKGLFAQLSEDKWKEIINSPTRSSIAQLSFLRIKEQLQLLAQEESIPFYNTAAHVEQIQANLTALLEIFDPYTAVDFPIIYQGLLTSIPQDLKTLTSYAVHSTGMTSLAGIIKAVERTLGKPPRILYGENTYFENIYAANLVSNASSIDEATEEDWKDVDLLFVQFNPVLKRIDFEVTEYSAEKIAENLHQCLTLRGEKPLTLALDCTLDYLDSPRVGKLLAEFQQEIEKGILNIICYRSGIKFDLFGLDNYCGAPLYMIHNQDAKWIAFDSLLTDPVLLTDKLSLNWFCLAYQHAAPQLELYRKHIFDNTRALLNKVPTRLFKKDVDYRIIPVDQDADPAFIDVKVSGPFHKIKCGLIVGGLLSIKCMQAGHPLFYRPSLGFYHPNFSILFSEKCSTIRLTLGLEPDQVDVLAECFEMIDRLNDSSR